MYRFAIYTALIVILVIAYSFVNDEETISETVEGSATLNLQTPNTANAKQLTQISTDKNKAQQKEGGEYFVTPPTVDILVKSPMRPIKDIPGFLKNYTGNLEDLPSVIKASLGQALQRCGSLQHNLTETEETELYFSGSAPDAVNKIVEICKKVDKKLIYKSYDLLESVALDVTCGAAALFFKALPPEMLSATMLNDFSNVDMESSRKEHLARSLPLLKNAAQKGDLSATLTLATEFYSSGGQLGKNSVQSLAYFLALNSVVKNEAFQSTIIEIGDGLFPSEVDSAKTQAYKLIQNWNTQKYLIKQGKL